MTSCTGKLVVQVATYTQSTCCPLQPHCRDAVERYITHQKTYTSLLPTHYNMARERNLWPPHFRTFCELVDLFFPMTIYRDSVDNHTLCDYPLYIRVKFIPCPPGFALSSYTCSTNLYSLTVLHSTFNIHTTHKQLQI